MSEPRSTAPVPAWVLSAELAMRRAGAQVVADHLRTGEPLVIEREGKVALVPAQEWLVEMIPSQLAAG